MRKISPCASSPRLGTLPRGLEKDSVSVVRLSSRVFSLGGVGAGGLIGLGNVVPLGGPLFGRKIVLKPVPAKVPVKFDSTPSGGGGAAASGCCVWGVWDVWDAWGLSLPS